jgi:thiosulfate/3-mercaptopyruvate sulfurtransferase
MTYTTLIDTATLAQHLPDDNWRFVDCRFDLANPAIGAQQFAQGHIPGAVYAHLDDDLSAKHGGAVSGGRHPLPKRERVRARLAQMGIGNETQVVAYDAAGGMFAARLWWMLRWIGHDAVAVLDGGWPAWQEGGHPTGTQASSPDAAVLSMRPALAQWIDVATVLGNIESTARVLIDARAPDRFDGSNETMDPVGGHIPGAVNRFFRTNLDADGRFKPASVLREAFVVLSQGHPVIHQCGSGVTACHNLLAMQHAGLPAGALYAGSWSEWVSDPLRPVAK